MGRKKKELVENTETVITEMASRADNCICN